jgi:hypothetical protein
MSDVYVRWGAVDLISDEGHSYKEYAMGITRARFGKHPIFAIPLSSAWMYADSQYLVKASFKIAEFLNMHPDQFLINRIADLILGKLPDLIKSRPIGNGAGRAFAEGEVRIDGERIEQFEAYSNGDIVK